MSVRLHLRTAGNALLRSLPVAWRRMLLKGFAEQPELAEACGLQVVPAVFLSPVPFPSEIDAGRLGERRLLPGIDLRTDSALALLKELILRAGDELARFPAQQETAAVPSLRNETYADFDAATLYAMLR